MNLKADMVIKNGQIYSVDLKDALTLSDGAAIQDGKFIAVGSNEELNAYIGANTTILDLQGNTVLPALSDSHLHASKTVELVLDYSLYDIQTDQSMSRDAVIKLYRDAVLRYAATLKNPKIIRCVGWNPAFFISFPEGQPTAADLDGINDDVPILLRSYDHHYLWANSKAMEMAGVDKNTKTPRNGVIERDSAGNPTGIFQETTAIDLLINHLSDADYSVEEYKEGILAYQKQFANNYGTMVAFDALNTENGILAYTEMAKAGELTIRAKTCFYADPSLPASQFDDIISQKGKYDLNDLFGVRTVKFFMDGSGLSFYMNEPFEKEFLQMVGLEEDYKGYPQWTQEEINNAFLKLDSAGLQIHVHCMGDGAAKMTLDAFEYVSKRNDIKKNRHTITHFMLIDDGDIKRMSNLGVIASVQPMWAIYDKFGDQEGASLLGKDRLNRHYAIGSMKKSGCIVTSGTDFPITIPPNPYIGMQCGITRRVPKSHPDHADYHHLMLGTKKDCMNLKDMVASYSIWGAYQCFLEDITGSIEKGKSADFVILDKKITDLEAEEIETLQVKATYFKGNLVYSK